MKFQQKFKFNYKKAFQLSLLVNTLVLVIGWLLLVQSPVGAVANLTRIGRAAKTTSYKLQMDKTDIVFVYCKTASVEPTLGTLRNQKSLTCPQ